MKYVGYQKELGDALRAEGFDPSKVIGVEVSVPARGAAHMKLEMVAPPSVLKAFGVAVDNATDNGKKDNGS